MWWEVRKGRRVEAGDETERQYGRWGTYRGLAGQLPRGVYPQEGQQGRHVQFWKQEEMGMEADTGQASVKEATGVDVSLAQSPGTKSCAMSTQK